MRIGCLRYCKSTIFQANHNGTYQATTMPRLFAILQKYDFPSKSQLKCRLNHGSRCCLRYCKSTIFQANHNCHVQSLLNMNVVCDTAKVRFSKQITTNSLKTIAKGQLFAILQKYDFPSKSQLALNRLFILLRCLRYCKSTIFQANHNSI